MKRAGDLPTRPGRRADAWRRPVVEWVLGLLRAPMWPPDEMRHADIRRWIIEQARRTLDPDRARADLATRFEGVVYYTAAGVLRRLLIRRQPAWRSPLIAENVMAVVQKTLDLHLKSARPGRGGADFDPADAARIAVAARLLAAIAWVRGGGKPLGLRQEDRGAALAMARDSLDLPPGGSPTTAARAFRLMIEFYDVADPAVRDAVLALIGPAIDDELRRPEPGRELSEART